MNFKREIGLLLFNMFLREDNFSVDAVKKSACDLNMDFEILLSSPSLVSLFLFANVWNVEFKKNVLEDTR